MTDAVWQNWIYWVMGALTNDAAQLAHFVGFYKAIQSAGAAGVFRLDSNKAGYMLELGVTWGLCMAAIVCVVPAVYLHVKDREWGRDVCGLIRCAGLTVVALCRYGGAGRVRRTCR